VGNPKLTSEIVGFDTGSESVCTTVCRAVNDSVKIVRRTDASTPTLFNWSTTGRRLQDVRVELKSTPADNPHRILRLTDAHIVSLRQDTADDGTRLETIELVDDADRVWMSATGPAPAGAPGPQVGRLTFTGPGIAEIPVYDHEWAMSRTGGSALGGGRTQIEDLRVEVASARGRDLFESLAVARRHATAELELFAPGTTDVEFTYRLSEVSVVALASRSLGEAAGAPLVEQVSLVAQSVRQTAGQGGPTYCWDITANGACPG
jgi:type VI protein secretion system component Hcp